MDDRRETASPKEPKTRLGQPIPQQIEEELLPVLESSPFRPEERFANWGTD